ncbi:MAG: murein L,D-transpeptidase, partial [Alphaproteobacteria bacterium HGW-Alphaproteobacteria-8]
ARDIKVEPPRPHPGVLLRAAAAAPNMVAHLASLAPSDPGYEALRARYQTMAALAARGDWGARIADGPTLRSGDRGPRVATLRDRLAQLGDYAPSVAATDPARFDAPLEQAVRAFQERHGLNLDGAVGPATLAAINTPAAFRVGQLAVNLERMRWMNRPLGQRRIVVNQPDYTVTLFDGDNVLFRERVVVGQVRFQTPEFSDEMEYIVLNPTWHLPRSIATKELLPLLQEDPSVLVRRGMRLVRTDGGPLPLDPSLHDFSGYTARNFPYSVKQAPSSDNALGLVKFMFPNGDSIYLHDTPTKKYFGRDVRALSHGCVRVQDPLLLATLLLAPQQADPRGFIDGVLATGRERYVYLDAPVPVHLTYRTAWVDDGGALQLRSDIYGRDSAALEALNAAGVAAPGA